MRIINLFVFSDQQEVDSREQAQTVFVAFDTKKITLLQCLLKIYLFSIIVFHFICSNPFIFQPITAVLKKTRILFQHYFMKAYQ